MIDANIPLAIQSPKPIDPLAAFASVASLRGQMSEIALRQAQAEQARQVARENEALAQQKNRDLSDQNTLQSLEKDPGAYADIHSGDPVKIGKRLGGVVQPKTISAVQDYVNKQINEKATLDAATLKNQGEAHADIAKTVDSLDQMRTADGSLDLDRINQQLPNVVTSLAPQLRILGVDPAQVPKSIHTQEEFDQIKGRIAGLGALQAAALTRKGEQAKQAQEVAVADASKANAAFENYKLDLLKGGAVDDTKSAALMDQLFAGKPELRAQANSIYAAGKAAKPLEPGAGIDAVKAFHDEQIGKPQGAKATQDAEEAGKLKLAKDMIPIEANAAAARSNAEIPAAISKEKQIAALSPGAFSGILDRTQRDQAINEADKIQQTYTEKVRGAQQLADTISAAQNGNKAAPGVIPIEQVRSVLANGRVNQAELKGVSSNAGSILDRIQGWVAGKTEGEPIPADVLKDMAALSNITKMAAERTWQDGLGRLKNRGVQVDKIAKPDVSIGPQTIRARDPQGKLHEAPAGTPLPAGWKAE